jgi:hypothetical protein
MSRWYQPTRLSNAKKAELKRLRADDEAFRLQQGEARLRREEHIRVDRLVREGQALGLDRDGIAVRFGLSRFAIALSERRILATGE